MDNESESQSALVLFCYLLQNNLLSIKCSPLEFIELSIDGLKEPRNIGKFTMCMYILCVFLKSRSEQEETVRILIERDIMNTYINIFNQEAFEIKKEICNFVNEYILCCLELQRPDLVTESIKEVLCYTLQIESQDGEFSRTVNTILSILQYAHTYSGESALKSNVDWFIHHNICDYIESHLSESEPTGEVRTLIELISICY